MEHKIVHSIDCPENWLSSNDWDSHRPLLWLSINSVPHDAFFEFGVGMGSTPLLKEWYTEINPLGKEFYSLESNKVWFYRLGEEYRKNPNRENSFLHKNHCITYSENYLDFELFDNSLLFVDLAPGELRKEVIEKHKNKAKVILAHDTEPGANYVYGMADVLSTFKYRLDYAPEGKPHTTAVSNFVDVTKWVE